MKNKIKFLGIIALILVIGFTMAACSDPDRPEKEPPQLTGTVSISGYAEIGETLRANTTNLNGSGTIFYQWKRGGTAIYGETDNTYVVQTADVGSTITVTVTRSGYLGSVTSAQTITVTDPRLPQLIGTVSISGTAEVDQTLTAITTSLGGSGTIYYQWKCGTLNIGTNSSTYTVQVTDVGSTITVTVTRSDNSGSVTSDQTVIVTDTRPPLTGTVSITGTAQVGQILTADTTNLGGSGTISYQWKRGTINIGTNSDTYTIQSADAGSTIIVTVSRTGYSGSVTSPATATVPIPLTGTVSITGIAQVGQTITANTNNLGGYYGTIYYQWNKDGIAISEATGSTYTIQADDENSTITVTVTRSGYIGSITSTPVSVISSSITVSVITFSRTVSGSITATNTGNMYVITLAQPGTLSVSLTSSGGTTALPNDGADVKWYNSNGTLISGGTSNGFSFPYAENMNNLAAGTYYIVVIGRVGIGNTGLYNIRVDYFTSEEEPNNTIATAQLLIPNLTVKGSITSSDTTDVFKYVLTQPGWFTVNVTKGDISGIDVRWYDTNGAQIRNDSLSYSGDWPYNKGMDLEAGTYYIRIDQYSSSYTGTYNLRAEFTAAENNEIEPNSTRATAHLLTSGQTVKGFISYQDNNDMYRIVLTQSKRVTVSVTKGNISSIYVRWYDADGTRIRSDSVSYSGDWPYNKYMDLEAGTYYIGIDQYSSSDTGTYNLTVTWN